MIDTLGLLLAVLVTAASVQDSVAGTRLLDQVAADHPGINPPTRSEAVIHLPMTDRMARGLTSEATIFWRDPTPRIAHLFPDETQGESDLSVFSPMPVRAAVRENRGCRQWGERMTRETGGMPELRLWARRALGAVVAVPASALLTVGSFGIAYGAASTSRASIWWLPLVLVLAAAIGIGFLIFLAVCLLSAFADDLGVLGRAVAYCVVLTTGAFFYALQVQAMHDRGQVERAVVTAVKYSSDSTGMGSDEWTAQLTDLSGRKLGSVDGSNLDVGDHLTVTVDPKGRFGVAQGSPPAKPRHLWDVAALLAVLQALLSSAKGFSTAGRTGSPS